jgi:hypothetical protein
MTGFINSVIEYISALTFVDVIITLLCLISIRDLLVKFGFMPKSWLKYKIFQPIYEIHVIKDTIREIQKSIQSEDEKDNSLKEFKKYPEHLIVLIAKSIYSFGDEIEYGKEPLKKSKYYVNTMETVHNNENLEKLTKIMRALIRDDEKRKGMDIDFIIVPKDGNPFLAKRVAEEYKAVLLVLKGENDSSRVKTTGKDDPEVLFKINFEGGNELIKKAQVSQDKKLNGIVVDCNASEGNIEYNAIKEFNEMVDKKVINANHVSVAYVLFRADDGKSKFDDPLENDEKYRLERYFDLNEQFKQKLYDLYLKNKDIDYNDVLFKKERKKIKAIDSFIKELKKDKKLYYNPKKKH